MRRDADDFDREIHRCKRVGNLADLDAGSELLCEFVEEWWTRSASRRLAPATRKGYAYVWDGHVLPVSASSSFGELTPGLIEDELLAEMEALSVSPAAPHRCTGEVREHA